MRATSSGLAPSRMTINIVSSPAIVPSISSIWLLSILYAMLLAYPGRVLMTPIFPEKCMEMKPDTDNISVADKGLCMRLYMVSLGRTYTYLPFILAALATFSCLRSRLSVACVSVNPSYLNSCNTSSWLPNSLLDMSIRIVSNLLLLVFIVECLSYYVAKLR